MADKRLKEQFAEVAHYVDMVLEHINLDQPDEAAGWCEALEQETATLKEMLERRAKKAAKK